MTAAALIEWERWERDPDGYAPGGDEPVYLDNDLAREFLGWSKHEKGNTAAWVAAQKSALVWWMERLGGVNLRRATAEDHLEPALDGSPGRRHKIEVIKAFYGWLVREKHAIRAHEDPTFRTLTVPQAKPAQWSKAKLIPAEHYLLVRDQLTSPWREALIVAAGTGWHVSEIRQRRRGHAGRLHRDRRRSRGEALRELVAQIVHVHRRDRDLVPLGLDLERGHARAVEKRLRRCRDHARVLVVEQLALRWIVRSRPSGPNEYPAHPPSGTLAKLVDDEVQEAQKPSRRLAEEPPLRAPSRPTGSDARPARRPKSSSHKEIVWTSARPSPTTSRSGGAGDPLGRLREIVPDDHHHAAHREASGLVLASSLAREPGISGRARATLAPRRFRRGPAWSLRWNDARAT